MGPVLLLLPIFWLIGLIDAVATLTSTACVDAAGFEKCQASVNAAAAACLAITSTDIAVLACGCASYILDSNCYTAHCWNRVYECEYQAYISQYLIQCAHNQLPVPYYPAPDNAPDSCSCNLGKVLQAVSDFIEQGISSTNNASSHSFTNPTQSLQEIEGCGCCELSGAISSLYSLCPQTDPTLIGLSTITTAETELNFQFTSCSPSLAQFNCVSDLGFSPVPNGQFFAPNSLPASGTATLSNLAGTVTAPASGSVFTYTNNGDGQVYTISAAGVTAGGGGGNGVKNGGGASSPTGLTPSWGDRVAISRGLFFFVSSLHLIALTL